MEVAEPISVSCGNDPNKSNQINYQMADATAFKTGAFNHSATLAWEAGFYAG